MNFRFLPLLVLTAATIGPISIATAQTGEKPTQTPPSPVAPKPPPAAPKPAPAQQSLLAAVPADLMPRTIERLKQALVTVQVTVLEDPFGPYERRSTADTVFDEFVRQRIALRLAGVRISAGGEILVRDPNLSLARYGKIELHDSQGNVSPAKVSAVLENYDALILEQSRPPEEELPWVKLAPPDIAPGDRFYIAQPGFVENVLSLDVEAHIAAGTLTPRESQGIQWLWWRRNFSGRKLTELIPTTAPVILNKNAHIVGLALDEGLWQTPDGRNSWIGTKILADTRHSPDEIETVKKAIRAKTTKCILDVEIEFRSDSEIHQKTRLDEGRLHVFGLLLDQKGTILIPTSFSRDVIGQIERLDLREGDRRIKATFLGAFQRFGAMLIRAPDIAGSPAKLRKLDSIPRGRMFYLLSVRRRFGRRYDKIDYMRCLDVRIGYKEIPSPLPRKQMRVGDFLVDEKGDFVGLLAPLKRDTRDRLHARIVRGSRQAAVQNRLFRFAEIMEELRNPAAHFDPDIRPKSRREERRFLWLGVEYQPMTAPLARALLVEKPTRGGKRGLLVKHVYADSPAHRAAIQPGDILLAMQVPGAPREFDLAPTGKWRTVYFASGTLDGRPQRLWRPRRNYLTSLLRYIGEGRSVAFRMLHNRAERLTSIKLEKAPDDFDTAEQHKDAALGLTVTTLTYEVRDVLNLSPNAPGIVVKEVVPGAKASVAQIRPFEIIVSINDRPVTSPENFEKLVREFTSAGRVELLLSYLGQSRIIEIEFGR